MSDLGDVHVSIEDDLERPRMPSGLPGGAASVNKKYRSPKNASQEVRKRQNAFKIYEMSMLFKPIINVLGATQGPPRELQGPSRDHSSTWKHLPERPWKRPCGPEEAQELSKNALETS